MVVYWDWLVDILPGLKAGDSNGSRTLVAALNRLTARAHV